MPPNTGIQWPGLWIDAQFKGILIFSLEKLSRKNGNEFGLLWEGGTKLLWKEQIRNLATLIKIIVLSFCLRKQVTKESDMKMLLGMELVSLKGFNEFMMDYEKMS